MHLGSVNEACVRGGEYELEHSMSARGCTGKAGQLVAVLGRRSSHAVPHDTRRGRRSITSASSGAAARSISEIEPQCDALSLC